MRREHDRIEYKNEWDLIVDCPFNGTKNNLSGSGIVLTGTGNFDIDPITGTNSVFKSTSDSHRLFIEISDFALQDTGRCKIELDFLMLSSTRPSYPNIIDNGKSANGGIFTQREGNSFFFAITNKAYNVSQTPSFGAQKLTIPKSSIQLNQWYHLYMERYLDYEKVEVTSNGETIGSLFIKNLPYFNANDNPDMGRLAIGGSYSWGSRYLNGCIKNLKIYRHI